MTKKTNKKPNKKTDREKEITLIQKIHKVGVEVGEIEKKKENPYYHSKYFDINALLKALNPVLEDYGLSVAQPITTEMVNGEVHQFLTTIVVAGGVEAMKFEFPLPLLADPQKMGSAITYYRRYALQSLFGLQAEDDDANKASQQEEKETVKDKEL